MQGLKKSSLINGLDCMQDTKVSKATIGGDGLGLLFDGPGCIV